MNPKQQHGAALLIALLILLMVTLMGVSAIKSGLFHERMAFNAQADEMAFHAAETAIGGVTGEAQRNSQFVSDLVNVNGNAQVHCVSKSSGLAEGACDNADTLDERASLLSQSSSRFDSKRVLLASDVEYFKDFVFESEGNGRFVQVAMPFSRTNFQEWRKVGPSSGQFSDENGLLDYSTGP
ncbi:MAG: PilX N-terminal domain-containing pilus assembly protein [Pseudomonadota bacterium]|nr:PilX N-terminal domain-containing pilus assembly protein [Pseudomonadota bacterium]